MDLLPDPEKETKCYEVVLLIKSQNHIMLQMAVSSHKSGSHFSYMALMKNTQFSLIDHLGLHDWPSILTG